MKALMDNDRLDKKAALQDILLASKFGCLSWLENCLH